MSHIFGVFMNKPTDEEIKVVAARLADAIVNCEMYDALGLLGPSQEDIARAVKFANKQQTERKAEKAKPKRKQAFSGHPMLNRYIIDEE
jgi:hypothetical protein